MSRDCGNAVKTRKHLSTSNPLTKQNRKTFRKISDRSSLSSNGNSPAQSDDDWNYSSQEVKNVTEEEKDGILRKLQCQVKELRHKLRLLEDCIENKDYAIGTVTREKDRALGEIRRLERNNKQLRQQLNDERNHYLEEKEKFCEEMTRCKKRIQELRMTGDSGCLRGPVPVASKISAGTWQKGDSAEVNAGNVMATGSDFRKSTSVDSLALYEGQDLSLQMAALRTENAKLRAIINEREERNYELCLRFLRMKRSKNDLRNRFQDLEHEYLQVITNLMEKIDEAREEFNFIIDQKFKKPLHSTNAKYIKMVQKNSRIAHENITLRMELQSMRKELSKVNIGQGDFGRKTEDARKSNSDDKPMTSRKVAGVRQMKSDGNLPPKTSDTDSNYMSKTSTTEPSTGSVADVKSSESIYNESVNTKSKTPNTQNTLFSDDILQKIFEIVDTQSSSNIQEDGEKGIRKAGSKPGKAQESPQVLQEGTGKRYVECTLNAKRFHEITGHTSAKKIPVAGKEKKESPSVEASERKRSDEAGKPRRKLSDSSGRPKSKSHYTDVKDLLRPYTDSDKPQENEGVSVKGSSSWHRVMDKDRVYQFGNTRRYRSRKERRQMLLIGDCCGLEEKLDTDGEISPDYDYDTSGRSTSNGRMIDQMAMIQHRLPDDVRERVWHETQTKAERETNSEDSAIGSSSAKIRNRNSISLHDELMEATKSQSQTDDPFWRRELNLHSLITKKSASSSRTYRLTGRKSRFLSEGQKTPDVMDEEDVESAKDVDVGVGTADEGEQSRSVSPLRRSKPGSQKEVQTVTHNTTSANPMVITDGNSEVVLRFLMPPAAILSAQSFLYDENCKESSVRSGKEQGSPPHSLRQLMITPSNVPSSCTTVDMAETSPTRENALTSRTLSAPALIESEWFNNFKMCEMKDCSTNT